MNNLSLGETELQLLKLEVDLFSPLRASNG